MNFELSDDQRMLVDAAAGFTRKQSPVTRMRKLRDDRVGWTPEMWKQMGELGWTGLMFPEALGGVVAHVVLEHVGAAHQLVEHRESVGMLEVDRDALLSAVARHPEARLQKETVE